MGAPIEPQHCLLDLGVGWVRFRRCTAQKHIKWAIVYHRDGTATQHLISPKDHMWITGKQWYFDVGRSALDCINSALATAHVAPASILEIYKGPYDLMSRFSISPTADYKSVSPNDEKLGPWNESWLSEERSAALERRILSTKESTRFVVRWQASGSFS